MVSGIAGWLWTCGGGEGPDVRWLLLVVEEKDIYIYIERECGRGVSVVEVEGERDRRRGREGE